MDHHPIMLGLNNGNGNGNGNGEDFFDFDAASSIIVDTIMHEDDAALYKENTLQDEAMVGHIVALTAIDRDAELAATASNAQSYHQAYQIVLPELYHTDFFAAAEKYGAQGATLGYHHADGFLNADFDGYNLPGREGNVQINTSQEFGAIVQPQTIGVLTEYEPFAASQSE